MDKTSRPELQYGSVDYIVNTDYCIRPIQEPIYVFAIDISIKAIHNNTTIATINAIQKTIQKLKLLEQNFKSTSIKSTYNTKNTDKNTKNIDGNTENTLEKARIRVGIVTFDKNIQYYRVDMKSPDTVKAYVVSSEDPLCPLPPAQWLLEVGIVYVCIVYVYSVCMYSICMYSVW